MSWLWTAQDAAAATGGTARGTWEGVTGVSIDTRSIAPGELFVALEGGARDGHDFVAAALEAGAAAAMVAKVPEGLLPDAPLLVVGDTLAGLEALGRAARARSTARVVAVTGSVGKTSTKEMLRIMLAGAGTVHAADKSFNNHWGVPLTLARLPAEADFAVIEIGMNHAGEITPLTKMARPHVALITTVAAVHLGNFGSVEEIADAKAEIFDGLEPDGTAVLPLDNPHHARLAAAAGDARQVSFGEDISADFGLEAVTLTADATVVRARLHGVPWTFRIGAPGAHIAANALGALACVEAVGEDPARAALALGTWTPPEGRGVRERILLGPAGLDGEIRLIDESFNANPTSVRAGLAVLGLMPVEHNIGRISRGRRIVFLGDMFELGAEEMSLHADLAAAPEMAAVDLVYCCGPRMRALFDALPREKQGGWFEDSAGLAERASRTVDAGDVCMVKGSKAARMGVVVEAIRGLGTSADASAVEGD